MSIAHGQQNADTPLPPRAVVIDVDSPERALYRIAIADLVGSASLGPEGAAIIRNDLKLISLFQVLPTSSFLTDPSREGAGIDLAAWRAIGAQGVVKGTIRDNGSLEVTMRFFELGRGATPAVERSYRGNTQQLRGFMHEFANEVVFALTGKRGPFGSRLVFARSLGRGRKDVFSADFDGYGVGQVSTGDGVNMLPNFGPGGIWYSRLTKSGMYLTVAGRSNRPAIPNSAIDMGVSTCNGRIFFTSTRDGNAEIYSARPDGSDLLRLTRDRGIDVSPACGPNGMIAFVSTRHGSPQIFVMRTDGSEVRRVTFRGQYNQTPAWCPDPKRQLIAFMGMSSGMDIFTLDLATQEYKRITQGQGQNKDPAFSPDCRIIAFASSRGGVYLSNPEGLNQTLVIPGAAETVRWSQ